jgi:hypothetical protein
MTECTAIDTVKRLPGAFQIHSMNFPVPVVTSARFP